MNRKKRIPLLLFLLLLLLIVCLWCHSEDIVKNRATSSAQVNPIVKKDIDFNFIKKENHLELTGNFSTDKSVQILHTGIGDTKFNNLSNINKELVSKEDVVFLTQKLLLHFNEHYQEGSISYANGKLTIEGVVDNDSHKDTISTLLASSTIDYQDNTRIIVPAPTAEELADIKAKQVADAATKVKMEAEEKTRLEAEAKVAENKAKEIADAKAKKEAQEKVKREAEALEEKIKVIIDSEHINFEVNKNTLTVQSINSVEQIADILRKHPTINVEIAGHTDNTGNAEYNLVLSQKRVDSVKAKLIELQIDNNRLNAVGYGANQPLVSNDTKEKRRINRRVEFKVIGE